MNNKRFKSQTGAVFHLNMLPKQAGTFVPPRYYDGYQFLEIPAEPHLASQYFYELSVMMEAMWKNNSDFDPDVNRNLAARIRTYIHSGDAHKSLDVSHRTGIWISRCRLAMLIHLDKPEQLRAADHGDPAAWPVVDKLDLICTDALVYNYTMDELMTSLHSLSSKICQLTYFGELREYFNALYLSCARYVFIDGHEESAYDMPRYTVRVDGKTPTFRVSEDFVRDTERIFYDLEHRFLISECLCEADPDDRMSLPTDRLAELAKTVMNFANPALKILKQSVKTDIFACATRPGDHDLFLEKNKDRTDSHYNVICFTNPDLAKDIMERSSGDFYHDMFEKLAAFDTYSKKAPDAQKPLDHLSVEERECEIQAAAVNYDYITEITALWLCRYTYENKTHTHDGLGYFLVYRWDVKYPLQTNHFYINEYPVMIQTFSEWAVWDPFVKRVHRHNTFIECFYLWCTIATMLPGINRELKRLGQIKFIPHSTERMEFLTNNGLADFFREFARARDDNDEMEE